MAATNPKPAAPVANYVIIAVIVSLIAVVVTFFAGKSFIAQAQLKSRIIDRKTTADKQLKINIENIHKLTTEYDALGSGPNSTRQKIANALPGTSDFPGLSGQMENIAKRSSVKLNTIDAALAGAAPASPAGQVAPGASGKATPIPFNFTIGVTGSYANLKNLIANLELSARPMRVTNITIGGDSDALNVSLSITTYYQPPITLEKKTEEVK